MSKLNGDTRHIPASFAGSGLNLMAFIDLPPRQETFEQAVLKWIDMARTRLCSREEAARGIMRLAAEREEQLKKAVERAMSPGRLYPNGVKDEHEE
jgi:hypothetical protein